MSGVEGVEGWRGGGLQVGGVGGGVEVALRLFSVRCVAARFGAVLRNCIVETAMITNLSIPD